MASLTREKLQEMEAEMNRFEQEISSEQQEVGPPRMIIGAHTYHRVQAQLSKHTPDTQVMGGTLHMPRTISTAPALQPPPPPPPLAQAGPTRHPFLPPPPPPPPGIRPMFMPPQLNRRPAGPPMLRPPRPPPPPSGMPRGPPPPPPNMPPGGPPRMPPRPPHGLPPPPPPPPQGPFGSRPPPPPRPPSSYPGPPSGAPPPPPPSYNSAVNQSAYYDNSSYSAGPGGPPGPGPAPYPTPPTAPAAPASNVIISAGPVITKPPKITYSAPPVRNVPKPEPEVEAPPAVEEEPEPEATAEISADIAPGIELFIPAEEIEADRSTSVVMETPMEYGDNVAMSKKEKKEKKRSKFMRTAAGETWEDPTLAEWESDDFRIFAGDLGNEVTDETLTRAFSRYPSFVKAKVVRDKRTNKTKGYGFVSFRDPNDFVRAMREMNGKYVGNRPIKLRKSSWKDRNIDIVRKKEKEKKRLGLR